MEAIQSYTRTKGETQQVSTQRERLLLPHMPIQFNDASSSDRHRIEHYITECFHNIYQAEITDFLPYLLSTHTNNKLTATIGFQPAATKQPLFLEQYLTQNIELELSGIINQTIERDQIVEVGNLTSSHRGMASQLLFVLSVAILHRADFKWVAFTATKQVQRLLKKLNLVTIELCDASPKRLINGASSWGRYYDDDPKVLVGNLPNAIAQLNSHKVIKFILHSYQTDIVNIAKQIRRS